MIFSQGPALSRDEDPGVRDPDIRLALRSYLRPPQDEAGGLLLAEEMPICLGRTRVDVATVSDRLCGFEIKSQLDTLARLHSQLRDYGAVFDEITLVIGLKHLTGILSELPTWCGILLAHRSDGEVRLEPFRSGGPNHHRDPLAIAQLLWREEALAVAERHGCDRGVRSKPKAAIWERLAQSLALDDLAREVRDAMKARGGTWRAALRGSDQPRPAVRRRGRSRRRRRSGRARAC